MLFGFCALTCEAYIGSSQIRGISPLSQVRWELWGSRLPLLPITSYPLWVVCFSPQLHPEVSDQDPSGRATGGRLAGAQPGTLVEVVVCMYVIEKERERVYLCPDVGYLHSSQSN